MSSIFSWCNHEANQFLREADRSSASWTPLKTYVAEDCVISPKETLKHPIKLMSEATFVDNDKEKLFKVVLIPGGRQLTKALNALVKAITVSLQNIFSEYDKETLSDLVKERERHDNVNYIAITANKDAKTKKNKAILCSAIFATTKSGVYIYYLGSNGSEMINELNFGPSFKDVAAECSGIGLGSLLVTICRHINYRWNFNSHVYILASESSTEFWTDKMKCSIIDANLFPIEIMEMYKLVKETDVEIKDNNLVTPMLLREEDSRQDTNQSSSSSRHTEVNQDDTSVSTRTTKTVKQLSDQKFQLKFNLWLVNKNGDYKDEETRKTVTNWCNNMREQHELLLKHGFDFKPQENRWATKLELFKVNKNDPT